MVQATEILYISSIKNLRYLVLILAGSDWQPVKRIVVYLVENITTQKYISHLIRFSHI